MELLPGQVAIHDDGKEHLALTLQIEGDKCEALFFTSNPNWAEVCRRATKEELAMACYVSTRKTYLAYVVRSIWNFTPTDQPLFPEHWVQSLRLECLTQQVKAMLQTAVVGR